LRTFNANWNQALYDPKDLANEGFFSLPTTYNNIQCFSGGNVLTKFPSNTFSFIIHFLASPNCKHLHQSDETNKTDGTYRFTQLHKIGNSKDLQENTPEAHMNHLIKVTGFTSMASLHEIYYKCFSCYGIHNKWQLTDDTWKIPAQYFPYCPHVTNWKTKFLHTWCFSNDLPYLALGQIVHPWHTLTLFQHLTMTSEIFRKTLQYFSKSPAALCVVP